MQLSILEIDSTSEYFNTVLHLADANAGTLGFLPYGAFRRLADEGLILACVSPEAGCIGYLLYDISGYKVKLRHLCIAEQWRGIGAAKELLKSLRSKTSHLQGVQASCRRDYNLRDMWASLGFVAVHERPGRRKGGSILTEWWLDYGHPDLLTALTQQETSSKICAAIDANIFYDLSDEETNDEDSKESKALLADWLEPEVELCLTDEIKNEIDRNKDSRKRVKLRQLATQFTPLSCTQEVLDETSRALRKYFPSTLSDSDSSDLRHLARVIGCELDIQFFITRDKRLLEEAEEGIYKDFDLIIIHPIDFILRLDELRRSADYQPIRLAGTSIKRKRIQSGEQEKLISLFLSYAQGESKIDFQRGLRQVLSNSERFECFTVGRRGEEPIALIAYDRENINELVVPIFRFRKTKLTSTILRHCIFDCFSKSAKEGRNFTTITEKRLSSQTITALNQDYFIETSSGWIRANPNIVGSSEQISIHLSHLCNSKNSKYACFMSLAQPLTDKDYLNNSNLAANIERIFYPAKISDVEIPSFIIPIQSWWAKDLFDKELAEEILWGAKEDLALKREVVYYRAKKAPKTLKAPGRILWYVSKTGGGGSQATLGAIRACSRLDEIIIGKPIDLHKKYRRLGVYNFKNVLETARNNFNRDIMAMKFSDTELFDKPVELGEIENILGRKVAVRAPYKLTSEEFISLYNYGICKDMEI
ncbi:GNAT family N-acetyltransferase [Nodosilinea sp. AN01ver1]|uniref:GNAT family N-acetyltransferase n=1 Tax=Nodosilinea sp. AN01ver1 TaxID=3423362 RepID=UPI003D31A6EA